MTDQEYETKMKELLDKAVPLKQAVSDVQKEIDLLYNEKRLFDAKTLHEKLESERKAILERDAKK